MAMTLQGSTMRSPEMVRNEWLRSDFPFSALWQTVQSGTLQSFLQEWEQKYPHALTAELIRALQAYHSGGAAPQFLKNGRIDSEGLKTCLALYISPTRDLDKKNFFTRNEEQLRLLPEPERKYSPRQAWALYVYLLLHLQFKPKNSIREEDTAAFLSLLEEMQPSAEEAAPRQDRLAVFEGKLYRCTDRKLQVYEGGWKTLYTSRKPLAGLAVIRQGVLLLCQDGTLADFTPQSLRGEAKGKKLLQVSGRGSHYCLLLQGGGVITNLPAEGWKDLRRVQVGLNSASGIYGNGRILHCGSTDKLQDYTDVVYAVTRTQDSHRYFALLRTGNRLFLPDQVITGVYAVDIARDGYVYATGSQVRLCGFDGTDRLLYSFPEPMETEELHCEGSTVLFGSAEKTWLTYLK